MAEETDSVNFRQTLYLKNASVEVSTLTGTVLVWVDAKSNKVLARVTGAYNFVRGQNICDHITLKINLKTI